MQTKAAISRIAGALIAGFALAFGPYAAEMTQGLDAV